MIIIYIYTHMTKNNITYSLREESNVGTIKASVTYEDLIQQVDMLEIQTSKFILQWMIILLCS